MPDLTETMRLVEQASARLCHDFGGLIGTVGGAVEMLADEAGRDEEIVAFARAAARGLAQRLRLMRAAWGPETNALPISAIRALAEPPLAARRIGIDTTALAEDAVFTPAGGRLALNLLLLAAECLPKGGTILLGGDPSDLFVRISGPDAVWPPGLATCLRDPDAALRAMTSPASLQMPLTALLAHNRAKNLSVVLGPIPGGGSGIAALRLIAA
jgi:histidine phosphotransferase ChpT